MPAPLARLQNRITDFDKKRPLTVSVILIAIISAAVLSGAYRKPFKVPSGCSFPFPIAHNLYERGVHEETISRLARLESISFPKAAPKGAALIVVGEMTAALPLAGVIDMGAEMKRLGREIEKARSDLGKMDAKLENPQFLAKAKEAAVEETRERKTELEGTIKRLDAALTRLQAAG